MGYLQNQRYSLCLENPIGCSFQAISYSNGNEYFNNGTEQHLLMFCQKGDVRISSNRFKEEHLCAGEILFVPRGSDYHCIALRDSTILIHYFNNTVCHIEDCILSFLYIHKHIEYKDNKFSYSNKLSSCRQLLHFMESVDKYISDKIHEPLFWVLKHKELIWLLSRYYTKGELRSFFHLMTDEQVPFKSLVLTHYRKTNNTCEFAALCGYGIHTFRRIFKKEFGLPVYQWLIQKRAENIRYRLSQAYIPFVDIMDEFNFSTSANLSNFCRKYLGDTPSNIRKKLSTSKSE